MGYQEPGTIMTESSATAYLKNKGRYKSAYKEIENQLLQGFRDIESAYLQDSQLLSKDYGKSNYALGLDFSNNMASIAKNAAQSEFNMMTSNIGQNALSQGLSDLERTVASAYDSYIQNYIQSKDALNNEFAQNRATLENAMLQNRQNLTDNAVKAQTQIDDTLAGEAANYAAMFNAPRQYLQYLIDEKILNTENINPNYQKYFKTEYDENNTATTRFLTPDEMDQLFYEYDEKGNVKGLSEAGIDFYNQMLFGTGDLSTSFNAWLAGTNKELYDWAMTSSPYGNKTNREDVFVNADSRFEDVFKKGTYTTTPEDVGNIYNPTPETTVTYTNSKDFGTLTQYQTNNNVRLSYLEGLSLDRLNYNDIVKDGKSESFTATYTDADGTKRKYAMKINKNAPVATQDVVNDIANSIGGKFTDNKLYAYGNKLYWAAVDGDTVTLREVTLTDEDTANAFWNTLSNPTELQKTYDEKLRKQQTKQKETRDIAREKREGDYHYSGSRQKATGTASGKW